MLISANSTWATTVCSVHDGHCWVNQTNFYLWNWLDAQLCHVLGGVVRFLLHQGSPIQKKTVDFLSDSVRTYVAELSRWLDDLLIILIAHPDDCQCLTVIVSAPACQCIKNLSGSIFVTTTTTCFSGGKLDWHGSWIDMDSLRRTPAHVLQTLIAVITWSSKAVGPSDIRLVCCAVLLWHLAVILGIAMSTVRLVQITQEHSIIDCTGWSYHNSVV